MGALLGALAGASIGRKNEASIGQLVTGVLDRRVLLHYEASRTSTGDAVALIV
jgi:uncharacterized membrane protein